MAFHISSFSPFILLFSLPFLFNFTFVSSTVIVSQKQLEEICEQTPNPDFCITSLENFLGGTEVDLVDLGIFSMFLAVDQAQLNTYTLEQLVQTMVDLDSNAKTHLLKCQMDYDVTLQSLLNAYNLFGQNNYKHMIELVNEADAMINECTMECAQLLDPLSSWKEDNQQMMWLNDIVLAILGMLNN